MEIKTERKRLQNELRATIQKKAIGKGLTGLEHLVETKASVIELPDHTVTIEPLLGSNAQVDNSLLGNSEVSFSHNFFPVKILKQLIKP